MLIRRVAAAETFALRQRVLRPHDTSDELAGAAGATHFAAFDGDVVIASGSVMAQSPPWETWDTRQAWRLRGMATAEDRRGQGIGAALLDAVVDHVRAEGGRLLWCNARVPARAFYERAAFVSRGEPWTDPVIGPHVAMLLLIEGTRAPAKRARGKSGL